MPGKVKRINGHQVKWGDKVTAKSTTKAKAQRQLNLLRAKEHSDWEPSLATIVANKKRRKK